MFIIQLIINHGRNVYIVGVTNVGKSSLINALLKHYGTGDDTLITTSEFPGTTLDLIEIPLDNQSYFPFIKSILARPPKYKVCLSFN